MAKRTKKLIDNVTAEDEIRLNKYLSDAGICSRRDADKYIAAGDVTVDGITAEMGTKVKPGQTVLLKGKQVKLDESLVLIAFNKPRGIVCTTDKRDKDNIIDYINYGKRIYPIGRLDKDSEGLILLTNDGNIVNKILRAGNNHEKEYVVTLNKPITMEFLKGMSAGVPILDTITLPCKIKALDKFSFDIILTQGLNRQIRRMCEYFGYKVMTLKRIRIMNINLGHLQEGGYRNITEKEIAGLNELISDSVNTPDTHWNSMEDLSDEEDKDNNPSLKYGTSNKTRQKTFGQDKATTANSAKTYDNQKNGRNRSKSYDKTSSKSTGRSNVKGNQKPILKSTEKSKVKTDQKPILKSIEKSNVKTNQKPVLKSTEKSNIKTNQKPIPKSNEKSNVKNYQNQMQKSNISDGKQAGKKQLSKMKQETATKNIGKSASRGRK